MSLKNRAKEKKLLQNSRRNLKKARAKKVSAKKIEKKAIKRLLTAIKELNKASVNKNKAEDALKKSSVINLEATKTFEAARADYQALKKQPKVEVKKVRIEKVKAEKVIKVKKPAKTVVTPKKVKPARTEVARKG